MRENQLNELQGVSILTKEFYNKLIRRIECTKPLAGSGIAISEKENGIEVSISGASGGSVAGYSAITLNVCSNGVPSTIVVFGKA
jgi:hypothetical protein